jgi:hypothetical protein
VHQVFLDSNSYLGFYSLTQQDVDELAKVAQLIELGKLKLLLPTQVSDEVRRNRAKVVAERIKPLQDARLQVSVPQMVLGSPTAEVVRKCVADAQRHHSTLLAELRTAAADRTLPADILIERLFRSASVLKDTDAADRASRRKSLGNPPGKGSSLGDGVNWEILLTQAPKGEPLCFVSADGDFASALDAAVLDEYLAEEWMVKKMSGIEYYRDIKLFLDDKFPQIRIASDVRKYFLIDSLIKSMSFAQSHAIVAELNHYDSFTQDEALRLLSGGMENDQVRWLAQDEDVAEILGKVLGPHRNALPKPLVTRWDYIMAGRGLAYGRVPTEEELAKPPRESNVDQLI